MCLSGLDRSGMECSLTLSIPSLDAIESSSAVQCRGMAFGFSVQDLRQAVPVQRVCEANHPERDQGGRLHQ